MATKLDEPDLMKAYESLATYTALANRLRLKAFFLIAKDPGLSFSQIQKKMKVEKGHLAYHLAILKFGGLVNLNYERKGRTTSRYSLTAQGHEMYDELLKHS